MHSLSVLAASGSHTVCTSAAADLHAHQPDRPVRHPQGVEACEPQVVDMLIDFVYSYSQDVLRDARTHSEAAGRAAGQVHAQDVELAIRSRNFAQPLSLQVRAAAPPAGPLR